MLPSLPFPRPDALTYLLTLCHPEIAPGTPDTMCKSSPEPGADCLLEAPYSLHCCKLPSAHPGQNGTFRISHAQGPLELSWAETQGTRKERPALPLK